MARTSSEARLDALSDLYGSIVELDKVITEAEAREQRLTAGSPLSQQETADRFAAMRDAR